MGFAEDVVPARILRKMLDETKPSDRIERDGWGQGCLIEEDGRRCLIGSLVEVPQDSYAAVEEAQAIYGPEAIEALKAKSRERYLFFAEESRVSDKFTALWNRVEFMAAYNDHAGTTKEDIVALLQECGL